MTSATQRSAESAGHSPAGLGYTQPLYILPFDHRHSYLTGMFGFEPPLDAEQHARVVESKQLIYEGFKQAVAAGLPPSRVGILVDEEFGAAILRDARERGAITALSVEGSGSDEFDFEYGPSFEAHILEFQPTFAKVLVRYNPEGDAAMNARQVKRLATLSGWCATHSQRLMFELLLPATKEQLAAVGGDKNAYDLRTRPGLMERAIHELQDAGVEPDVWKVEGLDRREDCERIVAAARRREREHVGCIILGRGADDAKVAGWLRVAAGVPGFIGFAVGRTSFWQPVADWKAGAATREEAIERIARHFEEWVTIFEQARDGG